MDGCDDYDDTCLEGFIDALMPPLTTIRRSMQRGPWRLLSHMSLEVRLGGHVQVMVRAWSAADARGYPEDRS